jgi:hypothetical protein
MAASIRVHLSLVIDSLGGAAAIAAIATCAIHLPAIRYGLEIGDEGYLWYGTLQALDGKIPIRDFRAGLIRVRASRASYAAGRLRISRTRVSSICAVNGFSSHSASAGVGTPVGVA